jgi:hypothetical protein
MVNNSKASGLIALIEDGFEKIESDIVLSLRKNDEEYIALRLRKIELEEMCPLMESFIEGKDELTLSAKEHEMLSEYLGTVSAMERIERLAVYFAGTQSGIALMNRIGGIR